MRVEHTVFVFTFSAARSVWFSAMGKKGRGGGGRKSFVIGSQGGGGLGYRASKACRGAVIRNLTVRKTKEKGINTNRINSRMVFIRTGRGGGCLLRSKIGEARDLDDA